MKLNTNPERRVLRQFAWASLFLFPALAWMLNHKHGLSTAWIVTLCGVGALIAGVQLVVPIVSAPLGASLERLITRPIFVLMSVVAFPIGFVVSHVLMALLYYLAITPIALVFRLTGRDVLARTLDPAKTSYWHERGKARDPASYFKLY